MAQTSAFITLLLLTLTAEAQDSDYVINNHGDTIQCTIKIPALGGEPKYQPLSAAHDGYVTITIEKIKEYYLQTPISLSGEYI